MYKHLLSLGLFLSSQASAVILNRVDLSLGAKQNPPGDLIKVEVQFSPIDSEVQLEVRGYVVTGDSFEIKSPLKARNQSASADGHFVLTKKVTLTPEQAAKKGYPIVIEEFALPYQDMNLELGNHKIGFEVAVKAGEELAQVSRTPLTMVTVQEEPRTIMTFERERVISAEETVPEDAVVITYPEPSFYPYLKSGERVVVSTVQVPTHIPGGFLRSPLKGWDQHGVGRLIPFVDRPRFAPRPAAPEEKKKDHPAATWAWDYPSTINFQLVTNRKMDGLSGTIPKDYANERGEMTYREQVVLVPKDHVMGKLEMGPRSANEQIRPKLERDPILNKEFANEFYWDYQGGNNRSEKLFTENLEKGGYWLSSDLLIYVHGYNNSLEFVALRYAQMLYDIRFNGEAMAFVWPSQGKTSEYSTDEKMAKDSEDDLARLLEKVVQANDRREFPRRIHLLAHSLGNRVLMNAIYKAKFDNKKPFTNIILVAPDIDAAEFVSLAPRALSLTENFTHYHCEEDKALMASRLKHVNKRIGEAPIYMEGIANIDAKNANTSILGHDYFVTRSPLLYDLDMLINSRVAPDTRVTLRRTKHLDYKRWYFP